MTFAHKALIRIYLLLALVGFAFANASDVAAIYGARYALAYCQASGGCDICSSCPKGKYTLGIGGIAFQSKGLESHNVGGYLHFGIREFSPKQRFSFALDMLGGAGQHSGDNALYAASNPSTSFFFELRPKVGVNLLSPQLPLFLNLAYTFEGYNPNVSDNNLYSLLYQAIGAELEGFVPLGVKSRHTYSVGYDYVFSGAYKSGGARSGFDSGGSVIRASLGYVYTLSESLEYYLKLTAKAQRFPSALPFIQGAYTQQVLGLELGLGF